MNGNRDFIRESRNQNFPLSSCEYGARCFHPRTGEMRFLELSVSRTEHLTTCLSPVHSQKAAIEAEMDRPGLAGVCFNMGRWNDVEGKTFEEHSRLGMWPCGSQFLLFLTGGM